MTEGLSDKNYFLTVLSIVIWTRKFIWRGMDLKTENRKQSISTYQIPIKGNNWQFPVRDCLYEWIKYFREMEETQDSHELGDYMENKYFSEVYELPDGTPCNFIWTTEDKQE